ncbi:MAG: hypothetical protein U9N84_03375 [Actinomycetota bacterium]|nr:hypothetical protein [Actinomycetota bacterium]
MRYQHTQTSHLAVFVLIGFVILFGFGLVLADEEEPASLAVLGASFLVIGAVVLWFNWLTVVIDAGRVTVSSGRGWPRRIIEVRDITAFRPVRNKWWYGTGVRKIPGGWMYNAWGLDAVEIEQNNGDKFRIGTDQPGDLVAALAASTSLLPSAD